MKLSTSITALVGLFSAAQAHDFEPRVERRGLSDTLAEAFGALDATEAHTGQTSQTQSEKAALEFVGQLLGGNAGQSAQIGAPKGGNGLAAPTGSSIEPTGNETSPATVTKTVFINSEPSLPPPISGGDAPAKAGPSKLTTPTVSQPTGGALKANGTMQGAPALGSASAPKAPSAEALPASAKPTGAVGGMRDNGTLPAVANSNAPGALSPAAAAVGSPGELVPSTGIILGDGSCSCSCLCGAGSFPLMGAAPEAAPPAQAPALAAPGPPASTPQAQLANSPLPSGGASSLNLPITAVALPVPFTPAAVDAGLAPAVPEVPSVDIATLKLSSSLVLGNLAQASPVPKRRWEH